ncbi:cell cycle control protein cwf2 [Plasmodium falciparum IGH-CR14]|uniref:Cell cycle control protein cwf2 n=1 Tax=Plasmodium falciparum IGH-CR14 TaxID=580059 RepID=A0A0L1IDV4_PLAFA|nr:cell cycle control protein cwf2 [Plasmodium falciparum IGH-CR14]
MSLKRFFNFLDDDNKTKKKINTNKNEVDDEKIINDEGEKIKDEKKYKEEGEQEKSEELPKEEKKGGKRRGRKKQTDDKKNDDDNDQNENYKINDQSQTTLNKIEEKKKGNDNKKKRGRKSKKDIDVIKDDTNEHNKDDAKEQNKDDTYEPNNNHTNEPNNNLTNEPNNNHTNEPNNNHTNEPNNNHTNEPNNNHTNEPNNNLTNEPNNNHTNEQNKDDTNEPNNNHTNEQNKDIICDQSKNVINNQSTHYGNQNDHGDPPSYDLKNKNEKDNISNDKDNTNDDKNCKKIEPPSQILLNTPPPPSGQPPTGIQNVSHNSPPVPPTCPPPPTPPAPPGQPTQSNYPSQYYNMYNNMSVENYMGYPYYYSQYYNVGPHQSNAISIDPNKEKQLNNNSNVSDGGKMKTDLFSPGNNYDKDINTDENNKNMSILGNNVSNYYMNNPINNYYNMYNYNYMNGMNNVNTLNTINPINPINPMTYNYYYDNIGMYDNNKMVDENVLNYCSILDKSIELMKKSDKVKEILKTPARLQITQEELNKIEYTEGSEQYNIWFGKYVTDRYDKSVKGSSTPRFVAKYKCNPTKDSGYTKADKSYTSKQYFCIYFARGCCAYGHNCLYKHRIPNENDELEFEASVDIFGREKFNTFKDDMTGVGTFNNDCRTLFIGSIFINNINQVPVIEKILYEEFLPFGNIEYVRYIPNKNIAFIQFTNRVNAEFAKIAMSDQPIENYSTALTIKWAFEIKNQPHNLIQYYNNPFIYGNTNQVISSTWENYLMQQQYGNHPMYANMNHMYNNTNIYPLDNNNNINSNVGVLPNTSLSEHQKKINDRSANLNNSLNKIDQMFDIQN